MLGAGVGTMLSVEEPPIVVVTNAAVPLTLA
jgi:hypothetical protein